jgi:hypothetical protein
MSFVSATDKPRYPRFEVTLRFTALSSSANPKSFHEKAG